MLYIRAQITRASSKKIRKRISLVKSHPAQSPGSGEWGARKAPGNDANHLESRNKTKSSPLRDSGTRNDMILNPCSTESPSSLSERNPKIFRASFGFPVLSKMGEWCTYCGRPRQTLRTPAREMRGERESILISSYMGEDGGFSPHSRKDRCRDCSVCTKDMCIVYHDWGKLTLLSRPNCFNAQLVFSPHCSYSEAKLSKKKRRIILPVSHITASRCLLVHLIIIVFLQLSACPAFIPPSLLFPFGPFHLSLLCAFFLGLNLPTRIRSRERWGKGRRAGDVRLAFYEEWV